MQAAIERVRELGLLTSLRSGFCVSWAMIGLAPETRAWLASGPTDMRRGFKGLALLLQETSKPLKELAPYEYICKIWTSQPERFILDLLHQMPGPLCGPQESNCIMTFRIAQISDTHLSDEKPFFIDNFLRIVEAINADRPNLVLHSGDITFDGVSRVGDLVAARVLHDQIDGSVRFIPGNHDVGEASNALSPSEPTIDDASRAGYCEHFGAEFWTLDVPGWRLLAINAMLVGSELAASSCQNATIANAAATLGERRLALFLHKPLFDQSPAETEIGGRFINPKSRRMLMSQLNGVEPTLVASGHIHQYRDYRLGHAHYVWAPSTGYIVPDRRQPRYGLKEVGYVEHRLEPDGSHDSCLVRVPGVPTLSIADFRP